jgi:hypothetical protein
MRVKERLAAQWDVLLQQWHSGDDTALEGQHTKELCHKGVPDHLRHEIWPLLIGNDLRITQRLYKLLCEKASALWPSIWLRRDAEKAVHVAKQTQRRRERHRKAAAARAAATPEPPSPPELATRSQASPLSAPMGTEEKAAEASERPPPASSVASDSTGSDATRSVMVANASRDGLRSGDSVQQALLGHPGSGSAATPPLATPVPASAATSEADEEAARDAEQLRLAQRRLLTTPIVGSEMSMLTIDVDIPRTFPELSYFQAGTDMNTSLRNILSAFAVYRPDIGYTQGMSFVAATILLHVGNEAIAFGAFANLMLRPAVFEAFGDGRDVSNAKFHARLAAFTRVMDKCQPRIAKRLEMLGVLPEMFISSW